MTSLGIPSQILKTVTSSVERRSERQLDQRVGEAKQNGISSLSQHTVKHRYSSRLVPVDIERQSKAANIDSKLLAT
jgi:hypothetical protein